MLWVIYPVSPRGFPPEISVSTMAAMSSGARFGYDEDPGMASAEEIVLYRGSVNHHR